MKIDELQEVTMECIAYIACLTCILFTGVVVWGVVKLLIDLAG